MILNLLIVIILIMSSIWFITLKLEFTSLNLMRVILSSLCAYYHFTQYNGMSAVLTDHKLKESHELEIVYMYLSTSMAYTTSNSIYGFNCLQYYMHTNILSNNILSI